VSRFLEATGLGREAVPAIQLVQVPVFYSYGFTLFAEFPAGLDAAAIEKALVAAGVSVQAPGDASPSNVSVAGESRIHVARVEPDPAVSNGWWLWGAADNVRLAAANALQIAEKLIAP
jgi:aspartate-semialdehyde dehydrogenase